MSEKNDVLPIISNKGKGLLDSFILFKTAFLNQSRVLVKSFPNLYQTLVYDYPFFQIFLFNKSIFMYIIFEQLWKLAFSFYII